MSLLSSAFRGGGGGGGGGGGVHGFNLIAKFREKDKGKGKRTGQRRRMERAQIEDEEGEIRRGGLEEVPSPPFILLGLQKAAFDNGGEISKEEEQDTRNHR